MKRLPAAFLDRQALAQSCIHAMPFQDLPLDLYETLLDAAFFVRLRPAESAAFGIAVARVRQAQSRRWRARP